MTVSFEPLRRIIDGLVHSSVADEPLLAARHRAFIAAHLAVGLGVLMLFPIWLALAGRPSFASAVAFGWLAAPLPIAGFLSRTGRYGEAHLLSAVALAGLVVWAGMLTGGLGSPALVLLAIVPAEAALSGSRRITLASIAISVCALAGLALVALAGLLPAPMAGPVSFAPILVAAAILYGAGLALRIELVQRVAEGAARDGEARYRILADNTAELITRHNGSGAVEFASPAARAMLGCSPAELIGHGLFDRVHVADRPNYLHALSEVDRTGEPRQVEFRLRRTAGDDAAGFVWAEMRCRPALDAAQGTRSVVAVLRDVTASRSQRDAFAEAQSSADQANQSKVQFLAHMSHELRTPLNAIIGFSEILQRELFGKFEMARHRDYIRLIHSTGEHLLQVVNSVLDMSKIEAGKFDVVAAPFPVVPVIDGALDMMAQQIAGRGIKLVRRIDRDLPEIVADRRACRQILLNLLSNAAKFTEAGGTVTVSATLEQGELVIEVRDTGIGIAANDLPRIGTPFVQADACAERRGEGTGLGVSVVKGLVALQGGTFALESETGRGTRAIVRLPIRPARHAAAPFIRPAGTVFEERERRRA
ncbi:PAS domain-containing sensor histidine kinase [Kaistia nematophila]|uniref:histidine kinase n=1 Tax=Kaistia nematophila TaxID=2994654 RepID=A0A9X3INP9_9HYPH|nr:PAS domain-containing sensor histidine kinase [Kaistia nematophila]MCX5572177.1 PAS domain-containing sensor histidine kinase [Kaistia nematophila]